jgi:hypothetical protein
MPHEIPVFELEPGEPAGEPLEVPWYEGCRLLGDIDKSTMFRLIRQGALRSFVDDQGLRWLTMRSIKRFQRFQLERGPVGRKKTIPAKYRHYKPPARSRARKLPTLREALVGACKA